MHTRYAETSDSVKLATQVATSQVCDRRRHSISAMATAKQMITHLTASYLKISRRKLEFKSGTIGLMIFDLVKMAHVASHEYPHSGDAADVRTSTWSRRNVKEAKQKNCIA